MPKLRRQRARFSPGFSLIELSIVIAIVSIVAVMGLEATSIFMSRTAYRTTEERLNVIKTALAKHRFVYGYLPCPANRSDTFYTSTYGKEYRSGGACAATALVTNVVYGDVPVRDLGLPLSYMKDGYGNKLRYVVTKTMTTVAGFPASTGLITIRTGKLETTCSTLCQQIATAAYVVLSWGSDARGSTSSNCVPTGLATSYDGMIDTANCRFNTAGITLKINGSVTTVTPGLDVFYDSRFNNGSVEESHFDDLILWQTKSQL